MFSSIFFLLGSTSCNKSLFVNILRLNYVVINIDFIQIFKNISNITGQHNKISKLKVLYEITFYKERILNFFYIKMIFLLLVKLIEHNVNCIMVGGAILYKEKIIINLFYRRYKFRKFILNSNKKCKFIMHKCFFHLKKIRCFFFKKNYIFFVNINIYIKLLKKNNNYKIKINILKMFKFKLLIEMNNLIKERQNFIIPKIIGISFIIDYIHKLKQIKKIVNKINLITKLYARKQILQFDRCKYDILFQ